MSNWKKVVEKQNAKKYAWPAGWDTREQVAKDLECSPDRVASLLSLAIQSGEVEAKAFPVWDKMLKRTIRVVGYRQRSAASAPRLPILEDAAKFVRAASKRLGNDPTRIQKNLPRRFRGSVTLDDIRRILAIK